ncbi:MAG: DUF1232 domain-containing protein [Microbacteriaceae bacterium]|nr:MAG: DUF1232 domain-containing protein [Microbacteriaceae bacterium]
MWWQILLRLLGWATCKQPDKAKIGELLRPVPDVIRLLRCLVADPTVPRGVRIWLVVLLVYLLSPVDLIPDFIPVLGYADDAIIVVIVRRFATRDAEADACEKHWPGTPKGFQALRTLAGLNQPTQ